MRVCSCCGAVHDGRKWTRAEETSFMKSPIRKRSKSGVSNGLCPGCLRAKRGEIEGVVTLRGSFLREHAIEIGNIVKRTVDRISNRNVGARIIDEFRGDDGITIQTTDQHMAEKIGKEVEKAFKGTLRIVWQDHDRFVRVMWERD